MINKTKNVAYMGPPTSFSNQAAIQHFQRNADFASCESIADVFESVENGTVDFGVVPVENSNEGMVSHTLDMFIKSNVKIVAEVFLDIHLNLLSNSEFDKITTVYTIPIAFAQCKEWFRRNLPDAKHIDTYSTAHAAEIVSARKNSAAVASKLASEMYGLKFIARSIEDYAQNTTRFLVISNRISSAASSNKTSLLFAIKDYAGALYEALKPFSEAKINLSKIESRPNKVQAWEYYFFVDLIGHIDDENVFQAVEQLKKHCDFVKILGSYPYFPNS
ncbi:prephenate dehydratase [bacterium]|nr:prephenate dehydratase [bacterium]